MADEIEGGGEIDGGIDGGGSQGGEVTQQPTRADYLLDGYNDAESQARAFKDKYSWALELEQMYQSDPKFREYYDGYGRQQQPQQQQVQQQPQQQPGELPKNLAFLKNSEDPAVIGAYQVALQNGGQLPEGYPNREAMMAKLAEHQQFWDNYYFSPHKGFESMLDHPAIQQKILQLSGQAVQPIQQQFQHQQTQQLIADYGPKLKAMHPEILQQFQQGEYGVGKEGADRALRQDAMIKKLMAGQQQPSGQAPPAAKAPAAAKAPDKPKTAEEGAKNAKDMADRNKEETLATAREFAKAKLAMMNGKQ